MNTPNGTWRVCIVNEFFYPDEGGGTGTVLSELAQALRRDFQDVSIRAIASNRMYRDAACTLPPQEDWNGVSILRVSTPSSTGLRPARRLLVNFLFGLKALFALLRGPRPDALLVGTAPPTVAFVADLYRRLTGTPFVYVVYDLEPDRAVTLGMLPARHLLTPLLRVGQRRWLHAAARTVVLGRCMQEYMERAYRLPKSKMAIVPVGCDAGAIAPLPRATRFRARHGLDGFVALYAGNFGRYHDFDAVLDAAQQLKTAGPDISFVLVGSGAQRAHILRRVQDEQLCNVRVLPFVPREEYADLLASADVSLVTLEPGMEGLCVPSKFYSILASGRPTVAMVAPACEVARVVREEGCGVQIAPGDAAGLARTLSHLHAHPAQARDMGRRARAALVDKYSTAEAARHYHRLLREAVLSAPVGQANLRGLPGRFRFSSGKACPDTTPAEFINS